MSPSSSFGWQQIRNFIRGWSQQSDIDDQIVQLLYSYTEDDFSVQKVQLTARTRFPKLYLGWLVHHRFTGYGKAESFYQSLQNETKKRLLGYEMLISSVLRCEDVELWMEEEIQSSEAKYPERTTEIRRKVMAQILDSADLPRIILISIGVGENALNPYEQSVIRILAQFPARLEAVYSAMTGQTIEKVGDGYTLTDLGVVELDKLITESVLDWYDNDSNSLYLALTPEKRSACINALLNSGALVRDNEGYIWPKDSVIVTGKYSARVFIIQATFGGLLDELRIFYDIPRPMRIQIAEDCVRLGLLVKYDIDDYRENPEPITENSPVEMIEAALLTSAWTGDVSRIRLSHETLHRYTTNMVAKNLLKADRDHILWPAHHPVFDCPISPMALIFMYCQHFQLPNGLISVINRIPQARRNMVITQMIKMGLLVYTSHYVAMPQWTTMNEMLAIARKLKSGETLTDDQKTMLENFPHRMKSLIREVLTATEMLDK